MRTGVKRRICRINYAIIKFKKKEAILMRNRIFGWSYPPGCSGPPDDKPASELVENVLELLEEAGVPDAINDEVVKLIEEWETESNSL